MNESGKEDESSDKRKKAPRHNILTLNCVCLSCVAKKSGKRSSKTSDEESEDSRPRKKPRNVTFGDFLPDVLKPPRSPLTASSSLNRNLHHTTPPRVRAEKAKTKENALIGASTSKKSTNSESDDEYFVQPLGTIAVQNKTDVQQTVPVKELKTGNKNLLSINDIGITMDHINSLNPGQNLFGEIIDFYLQHIWNEKLKQDTRILFVTTSVAQFIKEGEYDDAVAHMESMEFRSKDIIIFPLSDAAGILSGTHWVLLVYSKKDMTFYYLDSSYKVDSLQLYRIDEFLLRLRNFFQLPIKESTPLSLRQGNLYDCGIYVLTYAEQIAYRYQEKDELTKMPAITFEQHIKGKRGHILNFINQLRSEVTNSYPQLSLDFSKSGVQATEYEHIQVVSQQNVPGNRVSNLLPSEHHGNRDSTKIIAEGGRKRSRPIQNTKHAKQPCIPMIVSSDSDDNEANQIKVKLVSPSTANFNQSSRRQSPTPKIESETCHNNLHQPQPSTSKAHAAANIANNGHATKKSHPSNDSIPSQSLIKQKKAGKFTKKANKKNTQFVYIKCALKSIFRKDCPHTELIIGKINELALRSTRICFVASLNVLDVINRRYNVCIQTRNWSFFNMTNYETNSFFYNCFQAVTTSTHRPNGVHQFKSPQFTAVLAQYGIVMENVKNLNNIFKTLCQSYKTNFMNNIQMHAKNRIKVLLNLKFIQIVGEAPNKATKKHINKIVNFMFNMKAAYQQPAEVNDILRYIPNLAATGITLQGDKQPGFMTYYIKCKWFAFIPFFVRLQREISNYQRLCRNNSTKIQVRNFNVVPLHSHRKKHIKIDHTTFKYILSNLHLDPKKVNPKTGNITAVSIHEFIGHFDPTQTYNSNWFQYLNWRKIRSMGRQNKTFNYTLVTDGISVSVEYVRVGDHIQNTEETFEAEVAKQSKKYQEFGRKFNNDYYDLVIGIDPGYKLYIAAIIKELSTGIETIVKMSSKEYYWLTNQRTRDRIAADLTDRFETTCKRDRENTDLYPNYPTPQSAEYMQYISHRLKFFNTGIQVYTTNKYTRLQLDQYICKQKAMDDIVNKMIGNNHKQKILFCIGATKFSPSSPIKKYKRCPGTRQIIKFVKKLPQCDVVYVDEYNTSQVCSKCLTPFDKAKHKQWNNKGIRHRVCDNCHPTQCFIALPNTIVSPKSRRTLQYQKVLLRHEFYQSENNLSWNEANNMANCCLQYDTLHFYRKTPFQPEINNSIQKTVWNRDINAARNIIIKAVATITNSTIPTTLQRRVNQNQNESDTDNDEDHEQDSNDDN